MGIMLRILPLSILNRICFGLFTLQLVASLPFLPTILDGLPKFIQSILQTALLSSIVYLTPTAVLNMFLFTIGMVGPFLAAASSVVMVSTLKYLAREWSRRNEEEEDRSKGEGQTIRWKAIIIGTAFVAYALAIRWILRFFFMNDAITIGHLVLTTLTIISIFMSTYHSISSRRGVLCECAFLSMLVCLGLFEFGWSQLTLAEQTLVEGSNPILDHWLPTTMDGCAIIILIWHYMHESFDLERTRQTLTSAGGGANGSWIHLARAMTVLLLTHYIYQHVTPDSVPGVPWWNHLIEPLKSHTPDSIRVWFDSSSSSAGESELDSIDFNQLHLQLLPFGLSAISRAVAAIATFIVIAKQDKENEGRYRDHED